MSLCDFVRRSAKLYPHTPAVDDGRAVWTYAELEARVARLAGGLRGAGVEPGDCVAALSKNRAEYVALYFACARIGAVTVPLNWRLAAGELAWILEHARPAVVIAEPEFVATLGDGPTGAARYVFDEARSDWLPFEALLGSAAESDPPAPSDDAPTVRMYTSGTTGRPKGALLTHTNLQAATVGWLFDMQLQPATSRFLQVTPLFHVGGLLMVLSTAAAGATLLLLPEFEPIAATEALAERGVTHSLMVPAMLQWILIDPALTAREFPALELIAYGAAPMPVAVLKRAFAAFGCAFLQGYGLTETGGVLLTLRPEDHRWLADEEPPRHLGAAGRELFGTEVRVVDTEGNDVAPGVVGEIVARGPNVGPGYAGDPEATERALRGGWFHTGDLAEVDGQGYVYVVDRLTDLILVSGENVYPREVEEVLLELEGIADAGVIGIPSEHFGEEVLAFVVPRDRDDAPQARQVIRHCRERLARFKCPTGVEFVDALPRNAAGKLLKRELREPFWAGRERLV
ncbi:MAG: long-chain-fatty-acid--CoA ligase [Planctomycetota bacterium]